LSYGRIAAAEAGAKLAASTRDSKASAAAAKAACRSPQQRIRSFAAQDRSFRGPFASPSDRLRSGIRPAKSDAFCRRHEKRHE